MALSHLWPGRRGLASAAASTRRHTGQTSSARLDHIAGSRPKFKPNSDIRMDFVPSLERDRRPTSARDADVFRASGCAECLTGPARLIDGDTIVVADQLVRLHRCLRTRRSGGTRIYPPPTGSDLCHPGPYGWAFDTWAAIRRVDKAWRGGRPPDPAGSQGRRVPPKVPTSRQHQGETLGRPGCPVLAIDPFQQRVTETKPPDRAQW
jgi:hypothetical protein